MSSPQHLTVPVKIGRKTVEVDEKIADLVFHLNKCGLKTLSSCQEDPDGNSYLVLDFEKIQLASVVNTPYPVLLLKWSKKRPKKFRGIRSFSM